MINTNSPLPTLDTLAPRNGGLSNSEVFWHDHYSWLRTMGFSLRDRYSPKWIPTWLRSPDPHKSWLDCEDGVWAFSSYITEARRADGSLVALKRVDISQQPDEIEIGKLFSSELLKGHSDNRCVPFLDVFPVPDDENVTIIVTPLLYPNEHHPFETIGEVIDFFRQLFKGLHFMHQNRAVHRDIKLDNILADVVTLYDAPPHPWKRRKRYDFKGDTRMVSSRTRSPIRYYFIDFGLSRHYPETSDPHLEQPWSPGDDTVPEFRENDGSKLCDPFAVDVYCMGNYIRQKFTQGDKELRLSPMKGFDFMEELVADMVQDDPKQRPTMEQVVGRFEDIEKSLSQWKLRSPVIEADDRASIPKRLFRSTRHWWRQLNNIVRRRPAVPKA